MRSCPMPQNLQHANFLILNAIRTKNIKLSMLAFKLYFFPAYLTTDSSRTRENSRCAAATRLLTALKEETSGSSALKPYRMPERRK